MNTRNKMYRTNSEIKKHLYSLGFNQLYLFPHSRFMKDYHFQGQGFDAMGFKEGEKGIYLFQFKTNKKPSKQTLLDYKKISEEFYVKCMWITRNDGGEIVCYS